MTADLFLTLLLAASLVVLLVLALLVLTVLFIFRVAYGTKLSGKVRFEFDGVRQAPAEQPPLIVGTIPP